MFRRVLLTIGWTEFKIRYITRIGEKYSSGQVIQIWGSEKREQVDSRPLRKPSLKGEMSHAVEITEMKISVF